MDDLITKEFEELAKQINDKFIEAGKLMKEINELRERAGLSSFSSYTISYDGDDDAAFELALDDFYAKMELIDTDPLFNEMSDAGWSMSSLDCPNY